MAGPFTKGGASLIKAQEDYTKEVKRNLPAPKDVYLICDDNCQNAVKQWPSVTTREGDTRHRVPRFNWRQDVAAKFKKIDSLKAMCIDEDSEKFKGHPAATQSILQQVVCRGECFDAEKNQCRKDCIDGQQVQMMSLYAYRRDMYAGLSLIFVVASKFFGDMMCGLVPSHGKEWPEVGWDCCSKEYRKIHGSCDEKRQRQCAQQKRLLGERLSDKDTNTFIMSTLKGLASSAMGYAKKKAMGLAKTAAMSAMKAMPKDQIVAAAKKMILGALDNFGIKINEDGKAAVHRLIVALLEAAIDGNTLKAKEWFTRGDVVAFVRSILPYITIAAMKKAQLNHHLACHLVHITHCYSS